MKHLHAFLDKEDIAVVTDDLSSGAALAPDVHDDDERRVEDGSLQRIVSRPNLAFQI